MAAGRPRLIDSPETLEAYFFEFIQWATNNPIQVEDYVGKDANLVKRNKVRPLTFEGFERWLCFNKGINAAERYLYPDGKDGHKEFVEISTRMKRFFAGHNIEYAAVGEYQQNIIARYHGLANQVVNTNVEQPLFPDELDKSKIASE